MIGLEEITMDKDNDNVALIDLDDTLAAYSKAMYESLNQIQSQYEPPLVFERMHDLPEPWESRRNLIKRLPGWWLGLEKFKLGFDVLKIANHLDFEIEILTKGPRKVPLAWQEKLQWCDCNIPNKYDFKVAIVTEKHRTYGKFLCDDWPGYVTPWLHRRPRGFAIVPAHAYNTMDQFPIWAQPRVLRYDGTNLQAVKDLLRKIRDRKPGESISI
jgi:hypothetical protein